MRVAFANLAFTTGQRKDQHIVDYLIGRGYHFLGFVEANVDVLSEMVPAGWRTKQHQDRAAGKAGSGAAWAPGVRVYKRRRLRLGVAPDAVPGRRARMRKRWVLTIDVRIDSVPVRFLIPHWPPDRFRWLQPLMTRAVKLRIWLSPVRGAWVVLADYNMPIKKAARLLGGQAHGLGIVGFVTGPKVRANYMEIMPEVRLMGWTDHPAVGVELHARG